MGGDRRRLFFFKQKTAYEMRISDWSSDVCSSDLLAIWMGGVTTELYRVLRSHEPGSEVYAGLLELTATRPVIDVITGTSAGGLNAIGRASRRDRVCQSV